jgi:hypothetical protein
MTFFKAKDFEGEEIKTVKEEGPFKLTSYLNYPKYKYAEGQIISDFKAYIDKTYQQHYKTEEEQVECFDAWIALGDSMPTFRNTAIKYLWRYGKKKGSNKDDLMKTLHYVLMCLYVDHYKKGD